MGLAEPPCAVRKRATIRRFAPSEADVWTSAEIRAHRGRSREVRGTAFLCNRYLHHVPGVSAHAAHGLRGSAAERTSRCAAVAARSRVMGRHLRRTRHVARVQAQIPRAVLYHVMTTLDRLFKKGLWRACGKERVSVTAPRSAADVEAPSSRLLRGLLESVQRRPSLALESFGLIGERDGALLDNRIAGGVKAAASRQRR